MGRPRAAGRGGPTRRHADPDTLESGLSVVVAAGLLTKPECLNLFSCSRSLAGLVIHTHKQTQIMLGKRPQKARNNRSRMTHLMELAAQSSHLNLTMQDVLTPLHTCMFGCVVQLRLEDLMLAAPGLSCLQLAGLSRLRELHVARCDFISVQRPLRTGSGGGSSSRAGGITSSAGGGGCGKRQRQAAPLPPPCPVRTLHISGCYPRGAVVHHLAPLLEGGPLEELFTDDVDGSELAPHLPALHTFKMTGHPLGNWMTEEGFEQLLAAPALRDVRLIYVSFSKDACFRDRVCGWRELHFSSGAATTTLAALPRVERLVVTRSVAATGAVQQVSTHLQDEGSDEDESTQLALPALLSLCGRALAGEGALALGHIGLEPRMMQALADLPDKVCSVGLQMCSCFPLGEAAHVLINRLPATVQHLVLHGQFDLDELYQLVSSASRPMRITFHNVDTSVEGWESTVIRAGILAAVALELCFFM